MAGRGLKRAVVVLIGIAVFFAWTRLSGPDGMGTQVDKVPTTVFDGGGGLLRLDFTTNQPAVLKVDFSQFEEAGEDEERSLYVAEEFAPGTHSRTVDVSPTTYVYLELGVPDATVGAELSWEIRVDGTEVLREDDRLGEALGAGYAFFLQAEANSLAEMRSWVR